MDGPIEQIGLKGLSFLGKLKRKKDVTKEEESEEAALQHIARREAAEREARKKRKEEKAKKAKERLVAKDIRDEKRAKLRESGLKGELLGEEDVEAVEEPPPPVGEEEKWQGKEILLHVLAVRAECHAALGDWNSAFMDARHSLALVTSHLDDKNSMFGCMHAYIIWYGAEANDFDSVISSTKALYLFLVNGLEDFAQAPSLVALQQRLLPLRLWSHHAGGTALTSDEGLLAKARLEWAVKLWFDLAQSIAGHLQPRHRDDFLSSISWLGDYLRPLEECRALAITVPGPGSTSQCLSCIKTWAARAVAPLSFRGDEPEEWATRMARQPPIQAVEILEAVLMPLLTKAVSTPAVGHQRDTAEVEMRQEMLKVVTEVLSRVHQRLETVPIADSASSQGVSVEARDNRIRMSMVLEWQRFVQDHTGT